MRKKFGAYLKITIIFLAFCLVVIAAVISKRQWIRFYPRKVSQKPVPEWRLREKISQSSVERREDSGQQSAKLGKYYIVNLAKFKYLDYNHPYVPECRIWCAALFDLASSKGFAFMVRNRYELYVDSLDVKQKCENFLRMIDRPEVKMRIESPLAPPPKFNRADLQFIYALQTVDLAYYAYFQGASWVLPVVYSKRKPPSQAAIKKIEAAVRAFRAVIENFPREKYFGSYSQLYIGLLTYIGPRGHIGALEELSRVIRKYPRQKDACIMAQYYIGQALNRLGKKEEAYKAFKTLLEKYPEYKNWYVYVLAQQLVGEYKKARARNKLSG